MSSEPNPAAADTSQVLLEHHLKQLQLPTFLREYDKVARQCAAESVDYPRYLLRLTEQELPDRERLPPNAVSTRHASAWSRAWTPSSSWPFRRSTIVEVR